MKKPFRQTLKRITLTLLGGATIMTLVTACGKDKNIPDNRTKEEYQAEQNFNRFFDFLAAEKKDFSDVESYVYTVYVSDRGDTTRKNRDSYVINLKRNQEFGLTGDYQHKTRLGSETSQTVELRDGNIVSDEGLSEKHIAELAVPVYKTSAFEKLEIYNYRLNHPETSMKTVSYRLTSDSEILTSLKKYFDISKAEQLSIRLVQRDKNDYEFRISILTDSEDYYFNLSVTFKGE